MKIPVRTENGWQIDAILDTTYVATKDGETVKLEADTLEQMELLIALREGNVKPEDRPRTAITMPDSFRALLEFADPTGAKWTGRRRTMNNPRCPYCGEEMEYQDQWLYPFYICPNCYSHSPKTTEIKSQEEAYAAAMKREKKRKTYFEDFLQKHPKADMLHIIPLTGRDVPNLCRAIIYGETMNCPVLGCAACWNEEMEGEDE